MKRVKTLLIGMSVIFLTVACAAGCSFGGSVCEDADGDGYGEGSACRGPDCNDGNGAMHPGADEIPYDGLDNDCDPGTPDDDLDGDGFALAEDCDDTRGGVNPGADEVPYDGLDNDCEPATPDDDLDGDGFANAQDCDDNDGSIHPGALETCDDDVDQDCNGSDLQCNCTDADSDGYDDSSCGGDDCDDADPEVHPGGFDFPGDGVDGDCDGADLVPSNDVGVFVSLEGVDSNPGTRQAPVCTIAVAIALAEEAGKAVFVSGGEYNESVETAVSLFGGYESTNWTRDITRNVTTILAAREHAVLLLPGSRLGVEGFTLQGGEGSADSYGYSNGVAVETDTEAFLQNNVIIGGSGGFCSGVGFNYYSMGGNTITVMNNVINGGTGCSSTCGVSLFQSRAVLENNVIGGGGGETFVGVSACFFGSTGHCSDNVMVMSNNAIHGYHPIEVYEGTAVIVNNIVVGTVYIHHADDYWITLVNNDIWSHQPLESDNWSYDRWQVNSCVWRGCVESGDNIFLDPLWENQLSGDYHLTDQSPCIDAGTEPVIYGAGRPFDFEGDPRPQGGGWDIGPDEFTP